jgi:MOSC domain-containing protein YiiM
LAVSLRNLGFDIAPGDFADNLTAEWIVGVFAAVLRGGFVRARDRISSDYRGMKG